MKKNLPPIGDRKRGKKAEVERMFDAIAPRYDLLNRVLSLGIDQIWRRQMVDWLRTEAPRELLDVATGTGDVAIMAEQRLPSVERVVGVDISEEMLSVGRQKLAERGLQSTITLQTGDSEDLPFDDASFDAVVVAFGVRNFQDLDRGLAEIRRVLRPGGACVVLEFSRPRAFPIAQLYAFYNRYVLPLIGRLVSGDAGAYTYLPASIAVFPDGPAFLARMRGAGFGHTQWRPLTFGIASLYKGTV